MSNSGQFTNPPPARWLVALLVFLMMAAGVLANLWGIRERRLGAPSLVSGQPGFRAEYHVDPNGELTYDGVENAAFTPLTTRAARGSAVVWYRLTITNPSESAWQAILALSNDFILDATLYQPQGSHPPRVSRSGGTVGWYDRAVPADKVAFAADLPPRHESVLYVRVRDPVKQPSGFSLWIDARVFSHLTILYRIEFAGYFSLWLGLFVYNGILYAVLRRRDYLLYLVYMLCLAALLATASDVSTLLLPWPSWPLRGMLGMILLNLTVFSLIEFSRAFLETAQRGLRLDVWLRRAGWAVLALSLGVPAWFDPTGALIHSIVEIGFNLVVLSALPLIGLALYFRRVPQSGIYVLAFLPLIGALVYVMHGSRGMPDGHSNSLLPVSGSALELVFLAVALAWRYRAITDERDRLSAAQTTRLEHEVAQATSELRKTNESLARANRDKDRIFSILGHDLRAPAQQLSGLSRLMSEAPELMPARDAAVLAQDIEEACQAQLELLDRLILWGRTQSNEARALSDATSAADIVNAAVGALASLGRRKAINLTVTVEKDLAVLADAKAAETVLRNVIGNALKFTHPGGTVAVSVRGNGKEVLFIVKDTGVGIAASRLQQVLAGPVRSENGTSNETGSGIGLTICRDLARADGGELVIASEAGQGTTATLSLPRKANG